MVKENGYKHKLYQQKKLNYFYTICIPDIIDGIGAVLVEITAGVGAEVTAPL